MNKLLLASAAVLALGCNKKSDEPAPPPPKPAPPTEAPKAVEKPKPAEAPDPKLVERGAYLAKAEGCVVCHTAMTAKGPDLDNAFAGGLEMPDAAGTWRTPNITPDKSSGIGGWTDDQIARAIREGVRPDGSGLYVIMPFVNYAVMTDDDTKALVAFLRSLKPINKVVEANKDLKFPKAPLPMLAEVAAMRPKTQADADKPEVHGLYMSSLMLCNHCHFTPGKDMMPAGPDKMFSGGLPIQLPNSTGVLYSRNITSDPETGIGKATEEQIFNTLHTMVKPDGKPLRGPMVMLQSGWSQLEEKDIRAVAGFIKKLPPIKNKVPESTFKPNGPPPGAAAGSGAPPAEDKGGGKPAGKK